MDLDSWSALAPALVVLVLLVAAMPFKSPLPLWFRRPQRFVSKSFTTYLSLHEAEALDSAPADSADPPSPVRPATVVPLWRSLLIAFAGLVETLAWVSTAAFDIVLSDARETLLGLAIAFSWAYTVARTVAKPPATAPYDLIVIYFLHLLGSTLHLGGFIFEHIVSGAPLPSIVSLFSQSVNLAIIGTLLFVTMGMPIGLPSARVQKEDIVSDKPVRFLQTHLALFRAPQCHPRTIPPSSGGSVFVGCILLFNALVSFTLWKPLAKCLAGIYDHARRKGYLETKPLHSEQADFHQIPESPVRSFRRYRLCFD
jgi:ABC-type spermidine/putrescine transport system permease subunit I